MNTFNLTYNMLSLEGIKLPTAQSYPNNLHRPTPTAVEETVQDWK